MLFNKSLSLKGYLLRALVDSHKIQLAFRPEAIKFNEQTAVFLSHLNTHNGLSIGDSIDLKDEQALHCLDYNKNPLWLHDILKEIERRPASTECLVAGFFKITGYLKPKENEKSSSIHLEEIFCALSLINPWRILRIGSGYESPILLFFADSLVKIPNSEETTQS